MIDPVGAAESNKIQFDQTQRYNKKYNWEDMKVGSIMQSKSYILPAAKSWAARNDKDWTFVSGKNKSTGIHYVRRVS